MTSGEPESTALLLATCGLLLGASVVLSRASQRFGVPIAILFLLVGILSGSEGIGGIAFSDYGFAFRLGYIALTLILFDGGLNTPLKEVKGAWLPAGLMATVGTAATAGLMAVLARLFGLSWPEALLLGAVVSSTDAASVFAVLRGSGLSLKRRVGVTLELESGLNDPVAIILTTALAHNLLHPGGVEGWRLAVDVVAQLAIGAVAGWAIGMAGRRILSRLSLVSGGLYPAFTLALAILSYGAATLLHGSGFLAVYLAGLVLGNGPLPYRQALLRVHDAMAWLAQIGMFLVLGLLVFPSKLAPVAAPGLGLALLLAVGVRPLIAAACLLPFRYPWREVTYIGWVGLRGAVPVILATFPVLLAAPGAERLFHLVFFIVVANALVPGATVAWVTRRLGLQKAQSPAPHAVLGIESRLPLRGELLSFYVEEALVVAGVPLEDLDFPEGSSIMLVVRGDKLLPAKGGTVLQPGDHVYIVTQPEDRGLIQLMFGQPEEE